MVAQPAYQCVTEMVPYTVYKNECGRSTRPCTKTVMVREPVTNYVERQRVVCKPVYDTIEVPCQRVVCKPIHETDYVTQTYTVCRPVQTTQQVTTYCMQPTTQLVTVPVRPQVRPLPQGSLRLQDRGLHDLHPGAGGQGRGLTTMVPETQTRQVPIHRTRYVQEVVNDVKRITKCRMVQEVVTQKVPCVTWVCVPKTVTKQIPHRVCEQVAGDLLPAGHPDGAVQLRDRRRSVSRRPHQAGRSPSGQGPPTSQAAPSKQL